MVGRSSETLPAKMAGKRSQKDYRKAVVMKNNNTVILVFMRRAAYALLFLLSASVSAAISVPPPEPHPSPLKPQPCPAAGMALGTMMQGLEERSFYYSAGMPEEAPSFMEIGISSALPGLMGPAGRAAGAALRGARSAFPCAFRALGGAARGAGRAIGRTAARAAGGVRAGVARAGAWGKRFAEGWRATPGGVYLGSGLGGMERFLEKMRGGLRFTRGPLGKERINLRNLIRGAKQIEGRGGLQRVGRKIHKHATAHPETWGIAPSTNIGRNILGMRHLREIIRAPGDFVPGWMKYIGRTLEKRLPDGRGIAIHPLTHKFITFLD